MAQPKTIESLEADDRLQVWKQKFIELTAGEREIVLKSLRDDDNEYYFWAKQIHVWCSHLLPNRLSSYADFLNGIEANKNESSPVKDLP